MDILELKNKKVKISPHSITCKDERGKTCGIVRNITLFTQAQPRIQFEHHKTVNVCGMRDGYDLIKNLIISDGKLYYLYDLKPIEFYEKYIKGLSGFESDTKRYNQRIQAAEKAAEYITVIPCYIEQ